MRPGARPRRGLQGCRMGSAGAWVDGGIRAWHAALACWPGNAARLAWSLQMRGLRNACYCCFPSAGSQGSRSHLAQPPSDSSPAPAHIPLAAPTAACPSPGGSAQTQPEWAQPGRKRQPGAPPPAPWQGRRQPAPRGSAHMGAEHKLKLLRSVSKRASSSCFIRSTTSASHSKSKLSSSRSAPLRGQRLQQPRVLAGCLGRHPEPLQRVVAGRADTRVWGMGQLACWTGRLALLARLAAAPQVPPAAGCRCSAGGKGWRCTAAHGSGRPPSSRINARMLLSPPPTPLPNQVSQKSVLARACCLW